jgi:hypothetical protein
MTPKRQKISAAVVFALVMKHLWSHIFDLIMKPNLKIEAFGALFKTDSDFPSSDWPKGLRALHNLLNQTVKSLWCIRCNL